MALTEALRFLITSDSAQARSDLQRLGRQSSDTMSALEKMKQAAALGVGLKAGATGVEMLVDGLRSVGQFAVSEMGRAVDAASDLEQAQGAVLAVFRDSAPTVQAFGRQAADAVGLSNAAYQQQAATLGAFLQNLGQTRAESAKTSQDLIQVGADLSAAYGGQTSDAVNAIAAALRGARDPIERYGVSIREATVQQRILEMRLDTSTAEAEQQARAMATLALIQEQTASTAGMFARKQDTLAGQQQRLNAELTNARAELGEALLPAMVAATKAARDMVPVMVTVANATVQVAGVVGDAAEAVIGFTGSVRGALAVIPGLGTTLAASSAGIGALRDATGWLRSSDTVDQVAALVEHLAALQVAFDDGAISAAELRASLPPALREMAEALRRGDEGIEALVDDLPRLDAGLVRAAAAVGDLGRNAGYANPDLATLTRRLAELSAEAGRVGTSMFSSERAALAFSRSIATAGSTAGQSALQITRAHERIADAQYAVAEAQERLDEALIGRFLVSLGATSDEIVLAQIAERDATRGLADAKKALADAQQRVIDLRKIDEATLLDAEAAYIQAQRDVAAAQDSDDIVATNRAQAQLLRTEEALRKARSPATVEELADAEDQVARAQDAVTRAEIDARQSREDLNRVIERGKEGSDDLARANKRVEEAQRALMLSERGLRDSHDTLAGSTGRMSGATKTVNERFLDGVAAADAWIAKLVENKAKPEEFAEAIGQITQGLQDVATEAGRTEDLDAYLERIQAISRELGGMKLSAEGIGKVLSGPAPKSGGGGTQVVELQVNGQSFGRMIVDSMIKWSQVNGPIPVKTR